ncbi:hypothetical protein [Nocardia sp.]|uniref:hypothetical protein n=1 Tax=Nocardia sp. TaxID=1821 RepID=UPI00261EC8B6|nr:hypothetical protein [Nocardia sp.]
MAEWWRPPMRWADLAISTLIYIAACGSAWVIAGFVPDYHVLARGSGDPRYLPVAYAVGWFGIAVTLMLVPLWILRAAQWRQRSWTTALLAFPMLIEAWVLGLLTAIVAVSI